MNPKLANSLKQATPVQQVALYAEQGMWHDALTNLAQLRLAQPQDASLLTQWTSLLNSEKLDSFASYPITKCCQAD